MLNATLSPLLYFSIAAMGAVSEGRGVAALTNDQIGIVFVAIEGSVIAEYVVGAVAVTAMRLVAVAGEIASFFCLVARGVTLALVTNFIGLRNTIPTKAGHFDTIRSTIIIR